MTEQPGVDGATHHEQFVDDCRKMDTAWADGRFDGWLQEKLADERIAAGIDPTS